MKAAKAPPSTQIWSFDIVELDEARLELRVAGRAVDVQPMALNLLRCLLQAAPGVVGRDELLAQLCGRSADQVSRNVLSNAAGRLRRAIGDPQGRRVVSVAGTGYRLDGPVQRQLATEADSEAPALPPRAQAFLMRHWFDALHGRKGFDPTLSLCDVLRNGIEQAAQELADAPLALASLHQHLAEHDTIWADYDSAVRHFRAALVLQAQAGQAATSDGVLRLRFDLCRALMLGAASSGNSQRLAQSRAELAQARADALGNPAPTAATQLRALMAEWAMAGFDLDWPRAMQAADAAMQLCGDVPHLSTPQWFALHRNHGVTLARHGELAAGVRKLQTLLTAPERSLPSDDIQVLATRLNLGQFQWLAGQYGDALHTLEGLRIKLAGNALSLTTVGIEVDLWLAKACMHNERSAEARRLLQAAHERACARGASSELALSVLVPLTQLMMANGGEQAAALELLEVGIAPRLPRLSRPGQREALVGLAHWIRCLWTAGQQSRAEELMPRLSLPDLRSACLRPDDARAYEAWLRHIDRLRAAAPTTPRPASNSSAAPGSGTADNTVMAAPLSS